MCCLNRNSGHRGDFYQTYTSAETARWKHTWLIFSKRPVKQHHFSSFGIFQLPNDSQRTYWIYLTCILASSLDSFILSCPLAWMLSAAGSGAATPLEVWAAEFDCLSADHHLSNLEAPALPATSRPGWNVTVNDTGVCFLCAFKWLEGGQDEAIGSMDNKFFSESTLANVLSTLGGLLQGVVSPDKIRFCECSCQGPGCVPLWLRMKQWSMWSLVIFKFLPFLLFLFPPFTPGLWDGTFQTKPRT